jgi:DMSO/TMAO reductase YedYZ molybdopterin-dependent catalytic subunit
MRVYVIRAPRPKRWQLLAAAGALTAGGLILGVPATALAMSKGAATGKIILGAAPKLFLLSQKLLTAPGLPLPHVVAGKLIAAAKSPAVVTKVAAELFGNWVYWLK